MLEGEGILEDVNVGNGSLTFDGVGDRRDCQQRCRCRGSEELHVLLWFKFNDDSRIVWFPESLVCVR